MIVTVLGAHGQVARLLTQQLVERGDQVRGAIRSADQSDDIRSDGAEPVILDLESADPDEMDTALKGSDSVVFAAGAGPGSGPDRKHSLDRDGAVHAVESAERVGVDRFVILSSMGADAPPADDESFSVYLRAKAAADAAVRASSVDHVIVRPGGLTDDDPTGSVVVGASVDRGSIPRADVAAVLAEVVHSDTAVGQTFEVISGDAAIADALDGLVMDR